jgi:hypothetical protein
VRREEGPSAIWGGATLGLFVGLILGFFVGSSYWRTVLIAVAIGAASGFVANILGSVSDIFARRAAKKHQRRRMEDESELRIAEASLDEHSAADFETDPNAGVYSMLVVDDIEYEEGWREGYDSLDAFYAAHEARHPDIRVYAAVAQSFGDSEPGSWPSDVIVQRIARLAGRPSPHSDAQKTDEDTGE